MEVFIKDEDCETDTGEADMGEMKFAAGTWIYGTVGDRYLLGGYRQGLPILERVERIAGIEGGERHRDDISSGLRARPRRNR